MTIYEQYKNKYITKEQYLKEASEILYHALRMTALAYNMDEGTTLEILKETKDIKELYRSEQQNILDYFGEELDNKLLDEAYAYKKAKQKAKLLEEIENDQSRIIKCRNKEAKNYLDCLSVTGPNRMNNEDFAAVAVKKTSKLLLVCDGVGGSIESDIASYIVTKKILSWFYSKNIEIFLDEDIKELLSSCQLEMKNKKCYGATTVTCALESNAGLSIFSIGDSRAYIIKDGKFKQITKDDSEVWAEYECGKLLKDELRFHSESNLIKKAVEANPTFADNAQIYKVDEDYDGVLLVTDGISDILSDMQMETVFDNTNHEDFLKKLVFQSSFTKSEYPIETDENYMYPLIPTKPGKDNASAAVYIKRKSRGLV